MELKELLNKAVEIANNRNMTFILAYNDDHQWAVFSYDNENFTYGKTPEEALIRFIGFYNG